MDKSELLQKEQDYYREIQAVILDIVCREIRRWIIIAVVILLIWLGSWMVFSFLKDKAVDQPVPPGQEEGNNNG